MKTFVTEEDKTLLKGLSEKASAIIRAIDNKLRDAIDEIVNLFEAFDITSINVHDYSFDEDFPIEDDTFGSDVIQIDHVDLDNGTIYVVDVDGNDHESPEWFRMAPRLLSILTECLSDKLADLEKLKVGAHVRWNDPAIEDYDEEDREYVRERVFTVVNCPDEIEGLDTIVTIANDETEAEVYVDELVLVPEKETE